MPEILASPPWYLPVVLAMAAIVLLFQGNNRQNKGLKTVGLVLSVLAVAVVGVGKLIESDREKAVRLTNEIGTAVNARDWKRFESYLDPKIRFLTYPDRAAFVAGAKQTTENVDVRNVTISDVELTAEPGAFITNLTAYADVGSASYRLPTNWRFYWAKDDAGTNLTLYRIEYVPNPQLGQDTVLSRFVK